ncbi:MAG: BON domain-containing protein [Hyphomicrobium sp.]|uniref:BON domain-containing protein n=1 Tax=Hyphomicrobium sp. TaxID=82 RepID=UPI00132C4B6C|nr:BON domain-containing protein [Hyphomicrobium sp.]KAB2943174.1 MAG: BON domain-containing protein [Hyphomicrobium sp.]MBZ0209201.1 BON domain-containing protein [Hyphomicrobium sp.]
MSAESQLLDQARAALKGEVRLDHKLKSVHIVLNADGTVTIEAEAPSVAVKKIALERLAAVPGIVGIVDRLHVARAASMGDGEIRAHLRGAYIDEPAFKRFAIREFRHGSFQQVQGAPDESYGCLDIEVADGVVTLNGRVPGLESKRLAGLIAWWIPGTRDVVNGIVVDPPEDDGPDHIAEAVRLALEKDPFVNAGQVRATVTGCVVQLTGLVPTETERERAEDDAWCIFGVDNVVNEIKVA